MFNIFSSNKKTEEKLRESLKKVAEETAGTINEGPKLENLRLDCELSGRKFELYVDELMKMFPSGKVILGLKISCPIAKDIEMKIYRMFCKPMSKEDMEVAKSGNSSFDRQVYMLAKQADSVKPIISSPDFQNAVNEILKSCFFFEIKDKKITSFHNLQKLKAEAEELKAIMGSLTKLAESL